MNFDLQDLIKLGVAVLMGGIIGAERERHKKAVGLRTLILISMGSALFTMLSISVGEAFGGDTSRIASTVVSGIGFLGAGVILEEHGRVTGLTTAATIWMAAALGMAAGAGEYILSAAATLIAILVLMPLSHIENFLEIANEHRTYEITMPIDWEKFKQLKDLFKDNKIDIQNYKQERRGTDMVCTFEVLGPVKKHDKVVQKLLTDKTIKEVWF